MNSIQRLTSLGQSLWYDNIQRRILDNGDLEAMITRGEIRGVTSNPSIFKNAFTKTNDYDQPLFSLAWAGWETEAIFWQLAIDDITRSCDLFRNLYHETDGEDGYVSLEVHPDLAHDSVGTLAQAKDLWTRVNRSNLMIKIPATKEGLAAIHAAIASGINVNATLIFSIERYQEVIEAYITGLDEFLQSSLQNRKNNKKFPTSVASFFISRMDTKVDGLLPEGSSLRGKAAIANARLAYATFKESFSGPRWGRLAEAGARVQRPLWASTSTKNPAYPDTMYVDNLIGPNSVNTIPPQTLDVFRDHGKAEITITAGNSDARLVIMDLETRGISYARITQELEEEGVRAFSTAFSEMLGVIESRRSSAVASLGCLYLPVKNRIGRLESESVAARLWQIDPTLWPSDSKGQVEIQKRMGWLQLPETSRSRCPEIISVVEKIRENGIRKSLLLGMGGSSLAPEVMSLVFSPNLENRQFAILDSTDPAQVAQASRDFPPSETIYIVSSKSGGTSEVNAMLEHFWHLSGMDGSRFLAITDPGTVLEALAKERHFFRILTADPTVGGRFSVLAEFGLLPMAWMGMDLTHVLDSATEMMEKCRADVSVAENPGLVLGAVLGEAALAGRDKLTLIVDQPLVAFGSWLEQLIAESSGKDGKGIVVIDGEAVDRPTEYGIDRMVVYLRATGENDQAISALRESGCPVLEYNINDRYSLIAEFYRWEIAIAIACHILGVNAFDQPDVQDNKERTSIKVNAYRQSGALNEPEPLAEIEGIEVFTNLDLAFKSARSLLETFLGMAKHGDYIAINAYLPRNGETSRELLKLRSIIRKRTGCATTLGFGPRFLHSTGQQHKGGPPTGLFLQITADPIEDVEIPGQELSFGVLERAQALGDYEALSARGRRILRLQLRSPELLSLIVDTLE